MGLQLQGVRVYDGKVGAWRLEQGLRVHILNLQHKTEDSELEKVGVF